MAYGGRVLRELLGSAKHVTALGLCWEGWVHTEPGLCTGLLATTYLLQRDQSWKVGLGQKRVDGKFVVPVTDSPPPAPSSHMPPRIALATLLGQAANSLIHCSAHPALSPCTVPRPCSLQGTGPQTVDVVPCETVQHHKDCLGRFNSESLPNYMTLDTKDTSLC